MSWKKYFSVVPSSHPTSQAGMAAQTYTNSSGTSSNYSSFLPEIYAGHPNRLQRYYQYDDMDRDSDINAALDTIADFCTQSEEQRDEPFEIKYNEEANETEVKLIKSYLTKWVKLNDFKQKLWYMFRNTVKNGDMFFLRDPETMEWLWLDHFAVEGVRVDEDNGKEPKEYFIRGLELNRQAKFASKTADMSQYRTPYGTSNVYASRPMGAAGGGFQMAGGGRDPRQMKYLNGNNELSLVEADHVVHLSLSVAVDINWPFGQSILEPIFKVYKQKELLEDAIIIYRIQRAPERRVFYVDVGAMPPAKARAHLDQIKNEIHQRRIPNHSGGGSSLLDAAYNPLSIGEDYFFAQSAEGRGSKVETLQGGDNLGEIGDLSFFTKKMARGLRIPSSYLGLGEDEGGGVGYNDGKLGAALIQEFRFNKYCMRLQSLLSPVFDTEFKYFLKENGIEIDPGLFDLAFLPPQNFTRYRQIEVDSQQVGLYAQIADNKLLAQRFKLKRFLRLTEDELLENEEMWAEENAAKLKKATGSSSAEGQDAATDLGAVGVRPPSDDLMAGNDLPDPTMDGTEPPADGQAPGGMGGAPGGAPAGGPPPGFSPPPGTGPA